MTQIAELASLCNFEFSISYAPHKGDFKSAKKYLEEYFAMSLLEEGDIEEGVRGRIEEMDELVCIHFYPRNSIGQHIVYHHDIDCAIAEMIQIIKQDR